MVKQGTCTICWWYRTITRRVLQEFTFARLSEGECIVQPAVGACCRELGLGSVQVHAGHVFHPSWVTLVYEDVVYSLADICAPLYWAHSHSKWLHDVS